MVMQMRGAARLVWIACFGLIFGAMLGVVVVAATASPAAAHGVGGIEPSNYRTRVDSVEPAVTGVTVRPVDLGTRLELTNDGATDVVVLGYDGEPYLRVGPRGAFENVRSPATYLNRTFRLDEASEPVPALASPDAPPEWRRVTAGRTVRWHDHRAHWMSRDDPPSVQREPGRAHLIQRFEVELRRGDTVILARGDVRWIPGPSPWPWVLGAVVLAALMIVAGRSRRGATFVATAVGVVVANETLHVVGSWRGSTAPAGDRLGASTYAIGATLVALLALGLVVRRGLERAAPVVLIAGLFVAIAGGLADITVLGRSGLPTTLPADFARATVIVALGAGIGLAAVAGLRLRVPVRALGSDQEQPSAVASRSRLRRMTRR